MANGDLTLQELRDLTRDALEEQLVATADLEPPGFRQVEDLLGPRERRP
jgi:hypothetical protein